MKHQLAKTDNIFILYFFFKALCMGKFSKPAKCIVVLVPLIFVVAQLAVASEYYSARTCSALDIQDALTSCEDDDECGAVYLPECDAENLWTTGQYVTANISRPWKLIGAGKENTKIGYADYASQNSYMMVDITGGGLYEIGHFYVRGSDIDEATETHQGSNVRVGGGVKIWCNTPEGGCNGSLRVHHMKIEKFYGTGLYLCWAPGKTIVVDHCDIGDSQIGSSGRGFMYGVRTHGTNRRADYVIPATFGADAPDGIYIEQSNFYKNYHSVSSFSGAQTIVRYNTFTNPSSYVDGHGPCFDVGCGGSRADPGHRTGVYRQEIYNNSYDCGSYPWGINIRGGTGMVTDNTFTNCNIDMRLEMETCSKGADCTTGNGCPQSTSDNSKCYQAPNQWWVWNNTHTSGGQAFGTSGHPCIRENYEYFLHAPQSGDPVASYTKFTFPHPLNLGETSDPVLPDPIYPEEGGGTNSSISSPTGLRIVRPQEPCVLNTDTWNTPCGIYDAINTAEAHKLIDDDLSTVWHNWGTGTHWIILDMGANHTITKLRKYREQFNIDRGISAIYVSTDTENWGESLGSMPEVASNMASGWRESDITEKYGRYIKIVSDDNILSPYWREIDVYVTD